MSKLSLVVVVVVVVVVVAIFLSYPCSVAAAVYRVGDSSGWKLAVNYTEWATKHTFRVGDKLGEFLLQLGPSLIHDFVCLVFTCSPQHSVLRVTQADYLSCNINHPLGLVESCVEVPLSHAGPFYFICGIPGHCVTEMKLTITVEQTAAAPSSSSPGAAKLLGSILQLPKLMLILLPLLESVFASVLFFPIF